MLMDHDDMKSSLLQDLIEKIMEMKDGGSSDKTDASQDMGDLGQAKHDGDADAKISMLEIAKPGDEDADKDPMAALHGEPDDDDMKKPLTAEDMMAMKRKHMGL